MLAVGGAMANTFLFAEVLIVYLSRIAAGNPNPVD